MAIIGTFTHWANHTNEFTSREIEVSHPSDLPEGHPDYDKRGTTEILEVQDPVITSVEHQNVYCNISQVTVNRRLFLDADGITQKFYEIQYAIWVFESEQAYLNGDNAFYNYIVSNELYEGNHNNIFEDAYSRLKQRKGFEEMVDDI